MFSFLQYERGLRNFRAEQPHQHAVYYTTVIMSEVTWTKDELLSSLEGKEEESDSLSKTAWFGSVQDDI